MSTTIAVVDDEPHLREAVAEYLQEKGFTVVEAGDAATFRALAETTPIDIVVLDVAMPGEDGLSLARWLRRRGDVGIILATASGQPIDRIVGLELGADDYLVKPYDLRELLARVRSLVRRLEARPTTATGAAPIAPRPGGRTVAFGNWRLDLDGRRLIDTGGRTAELTPLEFDLLEILATRPNRVLSRTQIAELGRGETEGGEADRRIDIRITRLRKKIEPEPDQPRFIRTVRGEGYVFVTSGE